MKTKKILRLFPLIFLLLATLLIPSFGNNAAIQARSLSTIPNNLEPPTPGKATQFNGKDSYIAIGKTPELNLSTFTLELWFKWSGEGKTTSTGVDGVTAYPLLAKGRAEGADNLPNMNYFLGINGENNVLVADLEGQAEGLLPSLNHPIFGTTSIVADEWNHAAATYDGYKWQLFLNGRLETEIIIDQPVHFDEHQRASLATALNSDGVPDGFFAGTMDEVRIWDVALSEADILENINAELNGTHPHLVARWGLDEATEGSIASETSLVSGAPFNLVPNGVPDAPVLVQPADAAVDIPILPTLEVTANDPDPADTLTVRFYGRPLTGAGDDFSIIALPDTQKYAASSGLNSIFTAQTQWIVDNKNALNIAHVSQLGDCVDDGSDTDQWDVADGAFSLLEDPNTTGLADGISYSIAVGNKDQSPSDNPNGNSTLLYNQYFGSARFIGRDYYGGFHGSNFDNHYELFSASGMDFILISIEYDGATTSVLNWADALLTTYSNRRAIVVTHYMVNTNGNFGGEGQDIYDALKHHSNLFLLHGGHRPGEGRRSDTFNGNTVNSLLADYQSRSSGGNGWLRILEFSPDNNEVSVKTYSPTLNQFETDSDSQFTFAYDMTGAPDFELIGEVTGVVPGANASIPWPSLAHSTLYEWYVTVDDGSDVTTGTPWEFTTEAAPPAAFFSSTNYSVNEDGSPQATVTVDLTQASASPITVNYATSDGSASEPGDYAAANGSVTFNPGDVSKTFTVDIVDDAIVEGAETIDLTLTGSDITTPSTATITINDDDVPPEISFEEATYSSSENSGSSTVNVQLNHAFDGSVSVDYATQDDSATAGSDYTAVSGTLTFAPGETEKSFDVAVLDDANDEAAETLDLVLSNPVNGVLGTPSTSVFTIEDDDSPPVVQFNAATYQGSEIDGTITITAVLNIASFQTVTVDYATSDGTATAGSDYNALNNTLSFAPGEMVKTFNITILDDNVEEGDETVMLALSNPANATLGAQTTATVTIDDNDDPPAVSFELATVGQAEGAGNMTIVVKLDGPSSKTVSIDYATSDGTAAAGDDYTAVSGTLTFAPGVTSKSFDIPVTDDSLDEMDETVLLSLSNPTNATLGAQSTATATIEDDDAPPVVSFELAALEQAEDAGNMAVVVTLDTPSSKTVTVDYATSDGTAVAGDDYTAVSGTLTFAPGETSKTIQVPITADIVFEGDETFTLTLQNSVQATLGTQATITLTILNDDNNSYYIFLPVAVGG